jgi:alpha-beta hydrolase superfamily lysophospholipase
MSVIIKAEHSKAVVVLVHGMQEYSDRYRSFCDFLAVNGYSSLRYDLLGHGQHLPKNQRGYFGKHGWSNLLKQLHQQVQLAHQHFAGQPVILFGHSMGSIIIRSYLQHYHDFDGIILTGVPPYNPLWRAGKWLSQVKIAFQGAKHHSHLLNQLATGGFNKKIKNPATKVDWLCHNVQDVKNYLADEACGFLFTNRGYQDLFEGMHELGVLRHFHTKKAVPLLFLVGKDDPCAGDQKQVKSSIQALQGAGYHDLTAQRYPKMRHEILFETDFKKVYQDVLAWLDKKVN